MGRFIWAAAAGAPRTGAHTENTLSEALCDDGMTRTHLKVRQEQEAWQSESPRRLLGSLAVSDPRLGLGYDRFHTQPVTLDLCLTPAGLDVTHITTPVCPAAQLITMRPHDTRATHSVSFTRCWVRAGCSAPCGKTHLL